MQHIYKTLNELLQINYKINVLNNEQLYIFKTEAGFDGWHHHDFPPPQLSQNYIGNKNFSSCTYLHHYMQDEQKKMGKWWSRSCGFFVKTKKIILGIQLFI